MAFEETRGLKYSPQTGLIYRSYPTTEGTRSKAVPIIGRNGRGYRCINVGRKLWRQHRLIFSFMAHRLSKHELVDHINGDITDNRWENLRIVTPRENCLNRRRHREGKEPYIRYNIYGTYEIYIHIEGNSYHGSYRSLSEAIQVRDSLLIKHRR